MNERKFAIITGGSRGIGFAVANYFAKNNYNLALIALHQENLEHAKQVLSENYPNVEVAIYAQDIGDVTTTYALLKQILHNQQRIDVLFNSAGIGKEGTTSLDIEDFTGLFNVNTGGLFAITKAVVEKMKLQKSGYIFNVASIYGKYGIASYGAYAATKFAIVGFSQALSTELLPYGVKVTALCPSVVNTEMTCDSELPNKDKIMTEDIVAAVDFLLQLSSNIIIESLDMFCAARPQWGKKMV